MVRFKIEKSDTLTIYIHFFADHYSIIDRRDGVNYDACPPQYRDPEVLQGMIAGYRANPEFTECY